MEVYERGHYILYTSMVAQWTMRLTLNEQKRVRIQDAQFLILHSVCV